MTHFPLLIGVDTGGTFTDFVLFDGAQLRVYKRLSTPQAPEQAILAGIAAIAPQSERLQLVHGSTVATNAVLERKGARTVYITNRGLADVLTIGRQARRELYNLQPALTAPPVPPTCCLETGGRMDFRGAEIEPLTDADLSQLADAVAVLRPEAVAINLLFSFVDDRYERAIAARMPDGVFVSRSSAVLPEYKEYERGIATWLNAYVGPRVNRYLTELAASLPHIPISVMQSSGGTIAAQHAGALSVHMLLSGPAGGLAGAQFVAHADGKTQLLTFDMGGTSTDVALIDGAPRLTTEGRVAGYTVAVPMVDIHTIGAGGGSLARVFDGVLYVGPESAGAAPGPACYGRGGTDATVTDANLVLGRLRADAFLGGAMPLDVDAARSAIAAVARTLNVTVTDAARGIVRLANEHMAQALRVISVQRGIDPRGYTLVSFGGAGGLHVCALADALDIQEAMVPRYAGVLSALGMLAAPRSRTLSRTVNLALNDIGAAHLQRVYAQLAEEGRCALMEEGVAPNDMHEYRAVDLRYRGQSFALTLRWHDVASLAAEFTAAHEQRYGHCLPLPIELVTLRVTISAAPPSLHLTTLDARPAAVPRQHVTVDGEPTTVALYQRDDLAPGQVIHGPALVVETIATTYVERGWSCHCTDVGNLLLTHAQ